MEKRKLYLARFTDKKSGNVYYKIGYCYQYNAALRFEKSPDQYNDFVIKIITSAWGPEEDVRKWEDIILRAKPKNFWLEQKFSGITELRIYNDEEIGEVMKIFKHLRGVWGKKQ